MPSVTSVPGAADTKAEQIAGLPMLRVTVDRFKLARYGIKAEEVLDAIASVGGRTVGQVFEGSRRFDLQVRIHASDRDDPGKIGNIPVADPQGRLIPIAQLADIRREEGPNQISRENLQRRIAVEANVRGRDLAGFVAEADSTRSSNSTRIRSPLPPLRTETTSGGVVSLRVSSRSSQRTQSSLSGVGGAVQPGPEPRQAPSHRPVRGLNHLPRYGCSVSWTLARPASRK